MILGAILAGGQARRFGSDKALALWNGTPLIEHVAAALRPHVDAIVICGRRYGDLPGIADRPYPDLGPLGGLNAALHHATDIGCDLVLTAACDTPAIDGSLISRLVGAGASACLHRLPVMGIWHSADAALLDLHLQNGKDRSMWAWTARVGATRIDVAPPHNINHVDDLRHLSGDRALAANLR